MLDRPAAGEHVNMWITDVRAALGQSLHLRCLTLCRRWPECGLGIGLLLTIVIQQAKSHRILP